MSLALANPGAVRSPYGGGAALALVGPAAVLLAGVILLPTLGVIALSLFDWDLGARTARFVGLANFQELFASRLFWAALGNTLLYALVTTPVTLGLGLWLALLVERSGRARQAYLAIYLLPVLATFSAMAIAWELLLHPTIGPVNTLLHEIGLSPPNWLRDRRWVLPTFMVIGVWQHLGLAVLLFTGGLKAIPRDLYDAAAMDGAHGAMDRLRVVVLPNLGGIMVFLTTLLSLKSIEMFDKPQVLSGGGPGFASETLMHTLFAESFLYLRTGFGAALTVTFLVLTVSLAMLRRGAGRRPQGE